MAPQAIHPEGDCSISHEFITCARQCMQARARTTACPLKRRAFFYLSSTSLQRKTFYLFVCGQACATREVHKLYCESVVLGKK